MQIGIFPPAGAPALGLPPLPHIEHAVVGVDVGGMRKGFHAVALQDGQVSSLCRAISAAEIADWCQALAARTVAVDAPCRWRSTGRARAAERELHAEGMHAFATPTLHVASARPFYRWMLNGADLYLRLEQQYVLFDGRIAPERMCLETFPQAVACTLAMQTLPAREKRKNRRDVLTAIGLDTARLTNIDYLDAALCAVAGSYVRAGLYRAYGDGTDGLVFVPGRR
jgi:predicted nuclease with RNAse H fold